MSQGSFLWLVVGPAAARLKLNQGSVGLYQGSLRARSDLVQNESGLALALQGRGAAA